MLNGRLSRIAIIVIESGLVYSISVSCFLVTYVRGSFGVTLVEQSVSSFIMLLKENFLMNCIISVDTSNRKLPFIS